MGMNRYRNVHIFIIMWQVWDDAGWRSNDISLCFFMTYRGYFGLSAVIIHLQGRLQYRIV